jgi:hypothetical protein
MLQYQENNYPMLKCLFQKIKNNVEMRTCKVVESCTMNTHKRVIVRIEEDDA